MDFWTAHQLSFVMALMVFLAISLSNLKGLHTIGTYPLPTTFPRVSVLIPARNEEKVIEPCVRSALNQDYPDFEVIVLDDNSTDRTGAILAQLQEIHDNLKVIHGTPLPEGWRGKQWACHQLSQAASGEYFLFADADTQQNNPHAIQDAIAAALAEQADLISLVPKQLMQSWSEKLVVPILAWSAHSVFAFALAHRLQSPSFTMAVGQFLLFRRQAYEAIGGHGAVKERLMDDVPLARLILRNKFRWRFFDGHKHVSCRMYSSWREVYDGFSRNLFTVFNENVFVFFIGWFFLAWVSLEPPITVVLSIAGVPIPNSVVFYATWAVILALIIWSIAYIRFQVPFYLVFFYPFMMVVIFVIAMNSMRVTRGKKVVWKGRSTNQ